MDLNGQQSSYGPPYAGTAGPAGSGAVPGTAGGPVPTGSVPQPGTSARPAMTPSPAGGLPVPDYYGSNPLQGAALGTTAPVAAPQQATTAAGMPQPLQPVQQPVTAPVIGASGLPATSAPPAVTQVDTNDDNEVPADDVIWVTRAKRAIHESNGDPHRKVQLIQHLRSAYLKQRYGRTVRTDEG